MTLASLLSSSFRFFLCLVDSCTGPSPCTIIVSFSDSSPVTRLPVFQSKLFCRSGAMLPAPPLVLSRIGDQRKLFAVRKQRGSCSKPHHLSNAFWDRGSRMDPCSGASCSLSAALPPAPRCLAAVLLCLAMKKPIVAPSWSAVVSSPEALAHAAVPGNPFHCCPGNKPRIPRLAHAHGRGSRRAPRRPHARPGCCRGFSARRSPLDPLLLLPLCPTGALRPPPGRLPGPRGPKSTPGRDGGGLWGGCGLGLGRILVSGWSLGHYNEQCTCQLPTDPPTERPTDRTRCLPASPPPAPPLT